MVVEQAYEWTRSRLQAGLPIQASSFVGRERELDELKGMLAESRLLTLTGPGGCGKTRLALQAAAHLAEAFEDGVGFVELASLSRPEVIAESAARAVG
ncbi:MAG: AAA family ATPase, partial [Rubrobacter sp.]